METSFGDYQTRSHRSSRESDDNSGGIHGNGLGFIASVLTLNSHVSNQEHMPELGHDVEPEKSTPVPSIIVSSGQKSRRVWFKFKNCDELHAKALSQCFPQSWGIYSLKKKGNWILQIQLTELAFRLNDGIPELGENSTKNLIYDLPHSWDFRRRVPQANPE